MIRLVSFFFTVSATALGGALVAIQGLMLVRGDGGNVLVLAAAALALAVGIGQVLPYWLTAGEDAERLMERIGAAG